MIVGGVLSSIPGDPKLEGSWSLSAGSLRCSRWSFLQNVDCSARCGSCAAGGGVRQSCGVELSCFWCGLGPASPGSSVTVFNLNSPRQLPTTAAPRDRDRQLSPNANPEPPIHDASYPENAWWW